MKTTLFEENKQYQKLKSHKLAQDRIEANSIKIKQIKLCIVAHQLHWYGTNWD